MPAILQEKHLNTASYEVNLLFLNNLTSAKLRTKICHLHSEQEDAVTKLILHAIDAIMSGATNIRIYYSETDALVLALRRYPHFCDNTAFVTGVGQRFTIIPLKPKFFCSIIKEGTSGRHQKGSLPGSSLGIQHHS